MMFGLRRRAARVAAIDRLHRAVVDSSRSPALYGSGGLPDTVEGRFESLTLHVMVVVRRLRRLPPPAGEVAQELVDAVFAHLEIALRESGIGDFGVPKRMKKLGQAFYDRVSKYEAGLDRGDAGALASEMGARLSRPPHGLEPMARYCLAAEAALDDCDLGAVLAGPPFPPPNLAAVE